MCVQSMGVCKSTIAQTGFLLHRPVERWQDASFGGLLEVKKPGAGGASRQLLRRRVDFQPPVEKDTTQEVGWGGVGWAGRFSFPGRMGRKSSPTLKVSKGVRGEIEAWELLWSHILQDSGPGDTCCIGVCRQGLENRGAQKSKPPLPYLESVPGEFRRTSLGLFAIGLHLAVPWPTCRIMLDQSGALAENVAPFLKREITCKGLAARSAVDEGQPPAFEQASPLVVLKVSSVEGGKRGVLQPWWNIGCDFAWWPCLQSWQAIFFWKTDIIAKPWREDTF